MYREGSFSKKTTKLTRIPNEMIGLIKPLKTTIVAMKFSLANRSKVAQNL